MFPIMVIAIGIAVLVFGNRLAVLGAAVGALLGVGLLHLLPGSTSSFLALAVPLGLAALGFLGAAFAKGIVDIVLLVVGVIAGAAIVMGFLDLFKMDFNFFYLLLVFVGGVVGLVMIRRFKDWAMIILAGLIGGLLVTRGLTIWLPFLQDSIVGTLLVLVLAGGTIVYQGKLFSKR